MYVSLSKTVSGDGIDENLLKLSMKTVLVR